MRIQTPLKGSLRKKFSGEKYNKGLRDVHLNGTEKEFIIECFYNKCSNKERFKVRKEPDCSLPKLRKTLSLSMLRQVVGRNTCYSDHYLTYKYRKKHDQNIYSYTYINIFSNRMILYC
jgi:hypothetical protein